jgi:hypothetical protein
MKHARRRSWVMGLSLIAVLTLGIVISLLVLGSPERDFTATAYSDVIRFKAEGVATLQVRIFDLSGKEVWGSGMVSGWTVDWDRRNDTGERLAYGAYIYSAQGWNTSGDLIFQKNGKLALMPGDKVQLQAAPDVPLPKSGNDLAPFRDEPFTFQPMAVNVDHSTESWAFGQVGIGTTSPGAKLHLVSFDTSTYAFRAEAPATVGGAIPFAMQASAGSTGVVVARIDHLANSGWLDIEVDSNGNVNLDSKDGAKNLNLVPFGGNVGIGTTSPSASLEVHGSATNLLALYDPATPTSAKFRVEKDGDVRADGAYYSGTGGYYTGSADVAERINTSEWVEPGNVVEIDPEHPGFFCKSSSPYSTKVAGIISTSPGVILGNNFDEATDDWDDNRPVLAVTGRVPCKVSSENGPIEIGDLLVSSSTPGVAMRGDPAACIGAVVGKAMEPLEAGTGVITAQVMLR